MTTAPQFILFSQSTLEPTDKDISHCTVSGNPSQKVWLHSDNLAMSTKSGTWDCQAGTFRATMTDLVEFCYIIEGEAHITNLDNNETFTVAAGDAFVMEPGFRSQWLVEKYVRKYFTISSKN